MWRRTLGVLTTLAVALAVVLVTGPPSAALPVLVVGPLTLPGATVGAAYSETITAGGGTAPYTYADTAGSLPAGLSLASDGTLSGTPTASGIFVFTVTATDSNSFLGPDTGSHIYTMAVAAPAISLTTSLASGTVAAAYSDTVVASGGTTPYTYAVAAGALPTGLALASDGTLSGIPTASGSFSFAITATDSSTGLGPHTETQAYAVTVAAPTISLTTALAPGTVGTAYSDTVVASGGTAPYSYAITAGALPAGLTLSSTGTLSGTPTASGTFTVTASATDSSMVTGVRAYTLTIAGPSLSLTTSLTSATVGTAYSDTITAAGGTAPYTYAITAGALPAGLTLSAAGTLSGTPTASGTFAFTTTATDGSTILSGGPYLGVHAYTLIVAAPTLSLTTSLAAGTVGTVYSDTITTSGGTAPYSYTVTVGSLPAGLTLSSAGTLSGTPTASGTFTFTTTATDSSTILSGGPYLGLHSYTLTISAPTVVPPIVTLPALTLPEAVGAAAYSQTLTATGGTAPYVFTVTGGALPAGLSLSNGGILSGTPTSYGTATFTVTATDANGVGGTRVYPLVVGAPTIVVGPTVLPYGQQGLSFHHQLTASGGAAPYGFTVSSGALPAGLTLSPEGVVSGTPTGIGWSSFVVRAADSGTGAGPASQTRSYAMLVVPTLGVVTTPAAPTLTGTTRASNAAVTRTTIRLTVIDTSLRPHGGIRVRALVTNVGLIATRRVRIRMASHPSRVEFLRRARGVGPLAPGEEAVVVLRMRATDPLARVTMRAKTANAPWTEDDVPVTPSR